MTDDRAAQFGEFLVKCHESLAQQVDGHTGAFQALWAHTTDVVLMGAIGAHSSGWDAVSASLSFTSSRLTYTEWHVENMMTVVNENVAFTCELEHMSQEVDGKLQERTLRVSQGYQYEDGNWRIVFRHGDPMSERVVAFGAGST